MRYSLNIIILSCIFLASVASWPHSSNNDAVLLESVKVLTFEKGQNTAARRVSPILQLSCVGGSASYNTHLHPDVVQCVNMGKDTYGNIQWKCEADLDNSVKFGRTTVSCEGYADRNDPYVLRGSCGLEYHLDATSAHYDSHRQQNSYHSSHNYNNYSTSSSSFSSLLMWGVGLFFAYMFIRSCLYPSNAGNNPTYTQPPPYNPSYTDPQQSYSSYTPPPNNQYDSNWRPGFWSGLGGGSLLWYLFGRNRTPYYNQNYYQQPRSYWGSSYNSTGSSYSAPRSPSRGSRNASGYASTSNR